MLPIDHASAASPTAAATASSSAAATSDKQQIGITCAGQHNHCVVGERIDAICCIAYAHFAIGVVPRHLNLAEEVRVRRPVAHDDDSAAAIAAVRRCLDVASAAPTSAASAVAAGLAGLKSGRRAAGSAVAAAIRTGTPRTCRATAATATAIAERHAGDGVGDALSTVPGLYAVVCGVGCLRGYGVPSDAAGPAAASGRLVEVGETGRLQRRSAGMACIRVKRRTAVLHDVVGRVGRILRHSAAAAVRAGEAVPDAAAGAAAFGHQAESMRVAARFGLAVDNHGGIRR